ncbi:Kae1-associated serine/threonine protein kinase [Candidatus Woesearchaeota archaeon]|nr:MAG: Kae1-associated serine/threonine protein kinase [Candidatus Woesearchaeota archaeon]
MKGLIAQGAEAKLYDKGDEILKERFEKKYRLEEIDVKLRKFRTRREAKVLSRLQEMGFPSPKLISFDDKKMEIEMEKIDGPLVKDVLESSDCKKLCKEMGVLVRRMHDAGIIHGDLTTSNMILKEGKVFFIDFGLSFFSEKVEDKAVDLHLLREALESKHHTIWKECFAEVLKGYNDRNVEARLEKVEGRGRYKGKKK